MCYSKKVGTYDLIGNTGLIWKDIISNISNTCNLYNFNYIKTPIFESTNLFSDIIGKDTDVISKELYNFYDKNNDDISLRPEGTTGVIRSYLENKLYLNNNVSKFYYYGSMFRHENVEKGRYREFQQFGVEVFNSNSYYYDVEVISLAFNIFKNLGLNDIVVYINNLGSKEDKINYENIIRNYFKPHTNSLCEDCKKRLNDNPIRILDCKIDKRKDIVVNAPKIDNYINNDSKERFNHIINSLDKLNINYVINKNLVRGLNYYTDTVFEIKTNIDNYGSRNTICGGGRYNNIVNTDEDYSIPAMGFAIGLERLIDVLEKKSLLNKPENIVDYNLLFEDIELITFLRKNRFKCDINYSGISKYTLSKENNDFILKENNSNKTFVLDKDTLLKKIVNDVH